MDSTNLARRRLGEPQGPVGGQGVLDGEVVLVVEDGHHLAIILLRTARSSGSGGVVAALWRDGDGGQIDLLRHLESVVGVWGLVVGCFGCLCGRRSRKYRLLRMRGLQGQEILQDVNCCCLQWLGGWKALWVGLLAGRRDR